MRIDPTQLFRPIEVSKQEINAAYTQLKKNPMIRFDTELRKLNGKSVDRLERAKEKAVEQRKGNGWYFEHQGWLMGSFSVWPEKPQETSSPENPEGVAFIPRFGKPFQPASSFLVSADGVCHGFTSDEMKAIFQDVAGNDPDLPSRLVAKALERVAERGTAERFFPLQEFENRFPSILSELELRNKLISPPPNRREASRKSSTRQAFEAALGPVREEALAFHAHTTAVTNWLIQGDRFRRRQALEVLPGVLTAAIQLPETHAQTLELGRLIDQGHPWYEAFAKILEQQLTQANQVLPEGFAATVVRGLHRLSKLPQEVKPDLDEMLPGGWAMEMHEMLHGKQSKNELRLGARLWMCGQIEMVDFPKRSDQFKWMFNTLEWLFPGGDNQLIGWNRVSHYRPLLKGVMRSSLSESNDWLVPRETLSRFSMAQREVGSWVAAAFVEGDVTYGHQMAVQQLLTETWTPKQRLDASDTLHRFHDHATVRASARQAEQFKQLDQGLIEPMWTAGGPEGFEHKGVSVRPLRHPLELLREGEEMSHCVAGYSPQCLQGHSRIFALKDADTGERATLEVRQFVLVSGEFVYEQEQLFAQENQSPSLAIKAAARQFLERLNQDFTTQRWPEMEVPAELEGESNGPDAVFYEQTRAWMRSRHKGLYEALKQPLTVTATVTIEEPPVMELRERRQQRQEAQTLWNVVPAMPGLGL